MRSIDISDYEHGYNMLGLAINSETKHLFFVRQGPGDDFWELDSDGSLVASDELEKDGVGYGPPHGLALSGPDDVLFVHRPIYESGDVVDGHLIKMSSDGHSIISTFPDECYGGTGASYNVSAGHLYLSNFIDKKVFEVNEDGVLMDWFDTRSGATDIAYDHLTQHIFVVYDNDIRFRGVIDEYAKIDFRNYELVNSYNVLSVGIDHHCMAFDIDKQNGLFYILENNRRIIEFARDELMAADTTILEAGRTPDSVTDAWSAIDFDADFLAAPVVMTSIETFHGPNTAGTRISELSDDRFSVMIEEEQSTDSETSHVSEVVGYVAIYGDTLLDRMRNPIGEFGTMNVNQENSDIWHPVTVTNTYRDPIVIMQLMSYNGIQPAHMRLRNIRENSFEFQIEEWDYLDGSHASESIGYLVVERRRHQLFDGTIIEAGKINANHHWAAEMFDSLFESPPVILCHCQTASGHQAVVTRQRNLPVSGFEVRLQEEEANDDRHLIESIGYVAIGRDHG